MKNPAVPSSMRALVLEEFGRPPVVKTIPIPTVSRGEILVKIHSSPINPSDYSFMKGSYSTAKHTPVVPGFEASGTVVAAGGSFLSRRLLGKKVACFAPANGNGTWAEYMVTRNTLAVPLDSKMDLEQGSMLMVNPISVLAMVEIAKKGKHQAIANTAAASALGRFLNLVCAEKRITLVNIVRREEQAEILRQAGAKYILVSDHASFDSDLKLLFKELKVTLVFDALGGKNIAPLLNALSTDGELMIYGGLAEEPFSGNPADLIFSGRKISGFWTSAWVGKQPILKMLKIFRTIQGYMKTAHNTAIQRRITLDEVAECMTTYKQNMTAGKILVKP